MEGEVERLLRYMLGQPQVLSKVFVDAIEDIDGCHVEYLCLTSREDYTYMDGATWVGEVERHGDQSCKWYCARYSLPELAHLPLSQPYL